MRLRSSFCRPGLLPPEVHGRVSPMPVQGAVATGGELPTTPRPVFGAEILPLLWITKSYVLRRPVAKVLTSQLRPDLNMSVGSAHVPSKPGALTLATSSAPDSGCSARSLNSVFAVFAAPAPVLPPWAM